MAHEKVNNRQHAGEILPGARTFTKLDMAADSRPFHAIFRPLLLRQQIRLCSVAHTVSDGACQQHQDVQFSKPL
jgi:hypothetical protein